MNDKGKCVRIYENIRGGRLREMFIRCFMSVEVVEIFKRF